jgi:hypothetical protein
VQRVAWVADVQISRHVAAKMRKLHGVTASQVRRACIGWVEGTESNDRQHGPRLMIERQRRGYRLRVYLKPVSTADGIYRCVTAWRVQ